MGEGNVHRHKVGIGDSRMAGTRGVGRNVQRHKVGTGGSSLAGTRGMERHAVQCRGRRNRGHKVVGEAKELESKIGAASEWVRCGSSA